MVSGEFYQKHLINNPLLLLNSFQIKLFNIWIAIGLVSCHKHPSACLRLHSVHAGVFRHRWIPEEILGVRGDSIRRSSNPHRGG